MNENMLSIEVSSRCNLKCLNCFAHEDRSEKKDMPLSIAKEIIAEGRQLEYINLSLTGGEPFLWPHIIELLQYAFDVGYSYILINSNVHLLNEELCSHLIVFGKSLHITCSLNGFKEEHDHIRGTGSYDQALKGIETGLKYNLNLHIYTVVNRNNLPFIPEFSAKLFAEYPDINIHVLIQQRGIDNGFYQIDGLMLEPSEFIEMVKMAAYLSLSGNTVQILENSLSSVVARKLDLKWTAHSPEISRPGKLVVLQDGIITLNHSSSISLGNYNMGSLKKVLNSNKYKDYTEKMSEICFDCKYNLECVSAGKISPSEIFHNTGDMTIPFCKKVLGLLNDK